MGSLAKATRTPPIPDSASAIEPALRSSGLTAPRPSQFVSGLVAGESPVVEEGEGPWSGCGTRASHASRTSMARNHDGGVRSPRPGLRAPVQPFSASMVDLMLREYDEADFIVLPSQAAFRSFVRCGVPSKKLITIPLGVDPSLFEPGERARRTVPLRVLYVGRLELLKGVHYLLQAWADLGLKDAILRLVGPALPEIRPWLERLAGRNVEVVGEIRHSDLGQYYRSARTSLSFRRSTMVSASSFWKGWLRVARSSRLTPRAPGPDRRRRGWLHSGAQRRHGDRRAATWGRPLQPAGCHGSTVPAKR